MPASAIAPTSAIVSTSAIAPASAIVSASAIAPTAATTAPISIEEHRAAVLRRRDEAERLGEDIAELSSRIQAATYQLLVMLRAFDEREGWSGFQSCAHWLNWRTGLALGAAREKVRVARALGDLPLLSDAMRRGQLSYSKVRALTRVATPDNERRLLGFAECAPASYVERLARAWARVDRQAEAADERRRHERRNLNTWVDDDGMVVVRGRLSPEVGAVVRRALEAAADRLRTDVCAEEAAETSFGQRQADALGLLAESALSSELDRGSAGDRYQVVLHVEPESLESDAGGRVVDASVATLPDHNAAGGDGATASSGAADVSAETRTAGGDGATASSDAADVSAETRTAGGDGATASSDAADVSAETRTAGGDGATASSDAADVSAETRTAGAGGQADALLEARRTDTEGVSAETRPGAGTTPVPLRQAPRTAGHAALEDADGLRVSAENARRVACDAGAVVMRHAADGSVLDVGRKTRTVPPALRRALQARDRQCRFPGCNARRCDVHHVEHWADGGSTRLDNLVLLCRRHHRAVHEEGFLVRMGSSGDATFCWPDGRPFPAVPVAPRWNGPPLAPTDDRLAAAGIEIGPDTATPDWHGERLDLGYAIDVLWKPRTASGAGAAAAPA